MRRKEREITEQRVLEEIMHCAQVCRLAMSVDDRPYVIPLCFGYKESNLYFHCAREGMKLDILKKNNRVCFECDIDHELIISGSPCEWGIRGRSVIGFGRMFLIEEPLAKRDALDVIMKHYGGKGPFFYKEKSFEKALVIRVEIDKMTGKKVG